MSFLGREKVWLEKNKCPLVVKCLFFSNSPVEEDSMAIFVSTRSHTRFVNTRRRTHPVCVFGKGESGKNSSDNLVDQFLI